MNCREAQSLIVPFIEDKLDDDQLDAFLHHIENCSECYDELEVYFIVFSGIRQLDDDHGDISDFKGELKKYIQSKKDRYHKKHQHAMWIRAGIACAAFLVVFAAGFVMMYRSQSTQFFRQLHRQVALMTGDFDAKTLQKQPRDMVCSYLLSDDGETIKIIRKIEEKQNEGKDSSD